MKNTLRKKQNKNFKKTFRNRDKFSTKGGAARETAPGESGEDRRDRSRSRDRLETVSFPNIGKLEGKSKYSDNFANNNGGHLKSVSRGVSLERGIYVPVLTHEPISDFVGQVKIGDELLVESFDLKRPVIGKKHDQEKPPIFSIKGTVLEIGAAIPPTGVTPITFNFGHKGVEIVYVHPWKRNHIYYTTPYAFKSDEDLRYRERQHEWWGKAT
jgi:hypothetical protein